MISRKIIEVNTITDDNGIRPDIALEKGFNLKVLEYLENSAIVEIWSSDVIDLVFEERKNASIFGQFISELAKAKTFIRILPSHPESPEVIGEITKDEIIVDSSKPDRIGKKIDSITPI